MSWGVGGTGISRGHLTSRHPRFKHTEEALQSLGPFSFTGFLRSYKDTYDKGRPTRKTDKELAGGSGGVQTFFTQGPTLSRPPLSLDTTKVSPLRNQSRELVTWGMCVDPAVGPLVALFNRRDRTWYTRNSRRASSACASLNPTAHAEPARTTQAPTEQRPSSSLTIESRSSKNKEECGLQENLKSTFSR